MQKDIPGYEGLYSVTDDGRVWAYPKKAFTHNGGYVEHDGKWLSLKRLSEGYPSVALSKNNKSISHRVHRLIALTFLPATPGRNHVNHKNGVRVDNRASNLEWCTPKENAHHAIRTGLTPYRKTSKLTPEKVRAIRLLLKTGLSHIHIAPRFAVCAATISYISSGKIWKDVQ